MRSQCCFQLAGIFAGSATASPINITPRRWHLHHDRLLIYRLYLCGSHLREAPAAKNARSRTPPTHQPSASAICAPWARSRFAVSLLDVMDAATRGATRSSMPVPRIFAASGRRLYLSGCVQLNCFAMDAKIRARTAASKAFARERPPGCELRAREACETCGKTHNKSSIILQSTPFFAHFTPLMTQTQ